MESDSNSNPIFNILNSVSKNINEDIALLRSDFKKLSDIVIVLSVKVEETQSIKNDLKLLYKKVENISFRIFELEKAKEKLENLIFQVDKDNRAHEAINELNLDTRIDALNARFKVYDDRFPYLWKILAFIFILLGITLYVTKSYNEAFSIIAKIFAIF